MLWIELSRALKVSGVLKEAGTRLAFPPYAARALVMRGVAFWVDGPHKEKEIEQKEVSAPKEIAPSGLPTLEEFKALPKGEQAAIIRREGLSEEADLRSPAQMMIVYGAYLSERGGA